MKNIWDRWQALIVGTLAFLASLIAFGIAKYNAEEQRKRNFIAARSFLPETFSELTAYCRSSMAVFSEAWPRANNPKDGCNSPLDSPVPELPKSYRAVFQECIRYAEPNVGERLSYILAKLQIHHSRMTGLFEEFEDDTVIIDPENIIAYLRCIAEIQALINQAFDFARGGEPFDPAPLTYENYLTTFDVNGLMVEKFNDLEGFIKRAIARGGKDKRA